MLALRNGNDRVIVVDPGDSMEAVAEATDLILDPDHGDFLPFEWITDKGESYEAYIVFSDDGDGLSLIIPKLAGIDARLLALCEMFVTPLGDS